MIQDAEISQEHEEYFAYLNRIYREISAYLMKNDGFMDPHKLEMFFEKISSPYVFWKEKNGNSPSQGNVQNVQQAVEQEERRNLMSALEKKYGLILKDGKYSIKAPLSKTMFSELSRKMKDAGFKYVSGKGFVEEK